MTEVEPFYVFTPLGLATVYGLWSNGDDPEWITFIVATGECWTWKNEFIRRAPTVTNQRCGVSGFGPVNAETARQIERYKASGFLPDAFDVQDAETWPPKRRPQTSAEWMEFVKAGAVKRAAHVANP